MGALSLRLPASIHRHIKEIAKSEGGSINLLISSAVAEKISALMTEEYLLFGAGRGKKSEFKKIVSKVSSRQPIKGDEV